MRLLLNSNSDAGLPPAAKTVVTGETDLDKVKPAATTATPPAPKPASPPVKDAKWLETEIAVTEDKLRTLRDQHKATATKPAATTATRRKTGFECDDLN